MAAKILSPCVGICKFRDDGYCIGCGQTKKQKKKFKRLDGRKKKLRFVRKLVEQQEDRGGRPKWIKLYRRRYEKKGRKWPFDGSGPDPLNNRKAADRLDCSHFH